MHFTGFDHNLKNAVGELPQKENTSLEWLEASKYHFLGISEQKTGEAWERGQFYTAHGFVPKHGRGAPDLW